MKASNGIVLVMVMIMFVFILLTMIMKSLKARRIIYMHFTPRERVYNGKSEKQTNEKRKKRSNSKKTKLMIKITNKNYRTKIRLFCKLFGNVISCSTINPSHFVSD